MKEKTLDKDTIVAYHSFVQQRIRSDLNGLGIGPAWLPCRLCIVFSILAGISLIIGGLLIGLRTRHVYLTDWWAQFTGPFFIILFLLLAAVATYLLVIAKRRSNRYRSELFFRPIGDFGVAVVHKSNLQFEQETKPELKSGTTPHRGVMPNSAAYSEKRHREGQENRGYDRHGERQDRDRRTRDDRDRKPRNDRDHRPRDDRDHRPRDDRDRKPRDDRERRPHEGRDEREKRPRDDRDRQRHDDGQGRGPRDDRRDEERRRERKEREAMGEMDPREREYRERKDRERRERDDRRPRPDKPQDNSSPRVDDHPQRQGGRRTGRGAPKLPADASGFVPPDRVVLDADFGHPAGHLETSSRASESDL